MKTILCFGDSLTWGVDSHSGGRHPLDERWPGVAGQELGPNYHFIEEGLPGRTTVHDDPYSENRNGKKALPMLLESHAPIDLVVILLGANDFQIQQSLSAREVAMGIICLQQMVVQSRFGPALGAPECLVVSPPLIPEPKGLMATLFRDQNGKLKELSSELKSISESFPLHWMDSSAIISADGIDGVHLSSQNTRKLGVAIAEKIKGIV